jgi:hypothetical protein
MALTYDDEQEQSPQTMTRRRDDEPVDGVRVDLPFISLRMGSTAAGGRYRGEDDAYASARSRVLARLGFYRHLATYAAVIGAVVFVDMITGGGISTPVRWLIGIWGALVGFQFLNTFVFPSIWSRETEERMIEEEMRRHHRPQERYSSPDNYPSDES